VLYDAPSCWKCLEVKEAGGTPFRDLPSYVGGVCAVDGEGCA